MAVGLQRADTAPQENALELLDMACRGHGLKDSLPRAGFLLAGDGRGYADSGKRGLFVTAGRRVIRGGVQRNA
jgi:hypothetical protein